MASGGSGGAGGGRVSETGVVGFANRSMGDQVEANSTRAGGGMSDTCGLSRDWAPWAQCEWQSSGCTATASSQSPAAGVAESRTMLEFIAMPESIPPVHAYADTASCM